MIFLIFIDHTSYLHPDNMDYTSHYDGDNLGYSAQDNQYYPSTYLVDTSTLTLSEVPHSDGSFFHDFF